MSGRSKDRQSLADRALPFFVRVTPVAGVLGADHARTLFEPLGYEFTTRQLAASRSREMFSLELNATTHLNVLLRHLHVLLPVLDTSKHWWVDSDENDKLLAKAGDWLSDHPARELIARRAMKRRRALFDELLERLDARSESSTELETIELNNGASGKHTGRQSLSTPATREFALERTIGLHEQRLVAVADTLRESGATSVLDLGCGEGKLLERLLKVGQFKQLLGVDPRLRELERAAERLHLLDAGPALRERLALASGSLTYADRAWRDYDAAALVEVIEHVDPSRHASLELSLFGDARPDVVVITTPNADYNALFATLPAGTFRHPDHRFEWSREQFRHWCERVAKIYGYSITVTPLGEIDESLGGPSQMAVFRQEVAA